jgi:hypothetical protein
MYHLSKFYVLKDNMGMMEKLGKLFSPKIHGKIRQNSKNQPIEINQKHTRRSALSG